MYVYTNKRNGRCPNEERERVTRHVYSASLSNNKRSYQTETQYCCVPRNVPRRYDDKCHLSPIIHKGSSKLIRMRVVNL